MLLLYTYIDLPYTSIGFETKHWVLYIYIWRQEGRKIFHFAWTRRKKLQNKTRSGSRSILGRKEIVVLISGNQPEERVEAARKAKKEVRYELEKQRSLFFFRRRGWDILQRVTGCAFCIFNPIHSVRNRIFKWPKAASSEFSFLRMCCLPFPWYPTDQRTLELEVADLHQNCLFIRLRHMLFAAEQDFLMMKAMMKRWKDRKPRVLSFQEIMTGKLPWETRSGNYKKRRDGCASKGPGMESQLI